MEELKAIIAQITGDLICETHPEVCKLRDSNYPHLESLLHERLLNDEAVVSVQTAIAELETELGHL
ncbi:MAG: hypothetical protein AAFR36_31555 [Bacteroidota bacterium]